MDLASMDHLFAAVHSGNHYFTIQWCKTTGGFTVRDSLAHHTKPEHKEAMVLLWEILLASARAYDNLWLKEPVLMLSDDQVLGEFRALLLRSPENRGWDTPLVGSSARGLKFNKLQCLCQTRILCLLLASALLQCLLFLFLEQSRQLLVTTSCDWCHGLGCPSLRVLLSLRLHPNLLLQAAGELRIRDLPSSLPPLLPSSWPPPQ